MTREQNATPPCDAGARAPIWRHFLPGVADIYCLLLAAQVLIAHSMLTNDFWWHLALGEQTLEERALPTVDTLSYTVAGAPLSSHSWLSDALYAYLERLSGLGLVEVLGAVTVAATFRLVLAFARALGASSAASLGAVLVFAALGDDKLILRPLLFTYLGFAWLLLAYARFRDGSSRQILLAPVAVALWSNLHGGFLLALAFLGGAALLELVEGERRRAATLAALAGLSALAACLHPDGWHQYARSFENTPLSDPIHTYIDEWQPPDLGRISALRPIIVGAFAVALLLPRRPSLFEMGGFVASLFLALSAWRHVVLFGAFAGPVLAAWVTRIVDAHRGEVAARAPALPRLGRKLEEVLAFGGAPGAALALVAFALVVGGLEMKAPRDVLGHPAVRMRFPVDATEWVRANDVRGPMLNSYQLGGYLGWRLRGRQKVYVDSRLFIFRPIWEEFLHIEDAFPDWKPRLEKRGATWTILAKNSKLAPLLRADPAWKLVYGDRLVRIFARRDGPEGRLPEVAEPS